MLHKLVPENSVTVTIIIDYNTFFTLISKLGSYPPSYSCSLIHWQGVFRNASIAKLLYT